MPKQVDHQQRRAMIASSAARCIAEHGLQGATVRAIALSSGVSKGIVEHYFTDKDAVIAAALEQMNLRYVRREQRLTAGLAGLPALRARLQAILPLNSESRDEWKIRLCFWSVAAIEPRHRLEQQKRLALTRKRYEHDLEEAAACGEIHTATNLQQVAGDLTLFMAGASCGALLDSRYYSARHLHGLIERTLHNLTLEPTP
ncbi:MAG: TetR/AcrR family transcriptional regulator [Haliea sp.]|nr:TetR/AcrR family transcriptional regulator [Haliea sp.]